MKISSNIPTQFWARSPAILQWGRSILDYLDRPAGLMTPEKYRRFMLEDTNYTKFLGPSLPSTIEYIEVQWIADGPSLIFYSPHVHIIKKWLKANSHPIYYNTTLEELLHGRDRRTSSKNHGNTARNASSGPGWSSPLFAGLAHTFSFLSGADWAGAFEDPRENSRTYPLTATGRPSLSEAIDGAIPEAEHREEMLGLSRAFTIQMLQAGSPDKIPPWGNPPPGPTSIHSGEITAIRLWRTDGAYLYSCHRRDRWKSQAPMKGDPDINGIFAFKDNQESLFLLYSYIRTHIRLTKQAKDYLFPGILPSGAIVHITDHPHLALGTVKLWGDVIEHEHGYRAQFARPTSIDECTNPSLLPILQRSYHAPSRWNP